jgi:ATP-dependent Lon protease
VLCFVGHPGTGKTTFARSIAEAMGRKFVSLSLNGVHDEGEIRGHRPTYISARPGIIAQGLAGAKVKNPVIFLDEVEKASQVTGHHGNVSAALLTILDPEQNNKFRDNYIEIPIDLSQVFFVCAANNLRKIPAPLKDRMTIIHFPSYSIDDKFKIAQEKLIPKILTEKGLDPTKFTFTARAIEEIINYYDAP